MKKWYKYLIAGCLAVTMAAGFAGCGSSGDSASADEQVVIYTNADPEAQDAFKHALDSNGFEGKYVLQAFGTSELGGKLMAEGTNIEADLITMSTYYIDSAQKENKMFAVVLQADDRPVRRYLRQYGSAAEGKPAHAEIH